MKKKSIPDSDSLQLAHCVVEAIAEKKGEDILLLDIRQHTLFADYFVICSGTSQRQLKAIVEGISESTRKQMQARVHHTEGDEQSGWILMDYTDVIVHVFAPEQRHFYKLEELWKEAPVILRMQ